MSGSVQILKKSLKPTAEEGELLDIVLRESRRLDQIIKDFCCSPSQAFSPAAE